MKNPLILLALAAATAACKPKAPAPDMVQDSISFQVEGMRRINGAL